MPLKKLFLVILITIVLSSVFYANLDKAIPFFQKITGYTSIVIYGSVMAPQTNASTPENGTTLIATVAQPQKQETETQASVTSQTSISSTIEPQEQKEYVNQTVLLQVINQTKTLKAELDKLRTSSRDVLYYYSSINDTKNAEKWVNVIVLFNQALDELEKIQMYTENVREYATKENVNTIKSMVGDVLETLDKIVKLIKSS